MTQPRDPDEVEPTLVPEAPREDKPAADTSAVPSAADGTLPTPAAVPGPPPTPPGGIVIRLGGRGAIPVTVGLPHPAPAAPTPAPLLDATLETPAPPALAVDPDATLAHTGPAPVPPPPSPALGVAPAMPDVSPTLLPVTPVTPAPAVGPADERGVPPADLGATMLTPASAADDERGPLGTDTAPPSASGGAAATGAPPAAAGTMVGRFAIRGLHASGGLGEVFTARDTELNREVAVKRIKSRYADDPGSRSRFLSEATLTARLDHPGVVPVFGLVNDVRGRPCYAMRFIRGETLKDEIERYYQRAGVSGQGAEKTDKTGQTGGAEGAPGVAPTPESPGDQTPRTVAFRHLLTRFIATCQAIAYAHKKNIIHRDIKPANIMVGSFGETLVVDWGLAKCLDDGPDFERIQKAAAAGGFRHDPEATDLPSHMTSAGTAVGTPSYMAPEQAAGDIHNVGPRADIYSLGATLFVILTGKAPVLGKTTAAVLESVRRGAFESAAAVNPECPKPLDAIARKAMALRPEDRYATALELAADVEKWLSDEPVSCYADPLPARLARWARRHPARVAAAASLLLAGVLAAVAIAVVYREGEHQVRAERDNVVKEQKKTKEALDEVTQRKKETEEALRVVSDQEAKIRTQKDTIAVARDAAVKRYDSAIRAYGVLIDDIDKKLGRRAGMSDLRKTLLGDASKGLNQLVNEQGKFGSDRTLVAAYRQLGEVYQLLGDTALADRYYRDAVDHAGKVKGQAYKEADKPADKRAADIDLARSLDKLAGILMIQTGKADEALKAVTDAVELLAPYAADPKDAEAQQEMAAVQSRRSAIRRERGDTKGAVEDAGDALKARRALAPAGLAPGAPEAAAERARDLAASLDAVSALVRDHAASPDAMAALQRRVPGEVGGDLRPAALNAVALKMAEESERLRVRVAELFPDHPEAARERGEAYARLGDIHFEYGRMTAAVAEYEKGRDWLKKLKADDEQNVGLRADLAAMYGRLGLAELRLGEVEKALKSTREGVELAEALQKDDQFSTKAQRDLALARERYGDVLVAASDFTEGLKQYAASEEALRKLRDPNRAVARGELELARAMERIGDGCLAAKNFDDAAIMFRAGTDIRRAVYEKDPTAATAKRDYATGLYKLAAAQVGAGRPAEADAFAARATDLFLELSRDDPASAQARRDVALAYGKCGEVLSAAGRNLGAFLVWDKALDRTTELAKVDDKNTQALEDEAAAWERLAGFYAAVGNTDRAQQAAKTAVDKWEAIGKGVDAKTRAGRRRLALAMLRCGDISVEVRNYGRAQQWYKDAAREAASAPDDKLLGPVAKLAAEKLEYAKAVEAGRANLGALDAFAVPVRVQALQTLAKMALRGDDATTAYVCARRLAGVASGPQETYAAAALLAGCAATRSGGEAVKKEYAAEAVAQLKVAIAAGFRNADALSEPDWEGVRKYTKDLEKVQKELEKQRDAERKK
jgi:serine/threonine protein kinase